MHDRSSFRHTTRWPLAACVVCCVVLFLGGCAQAPSSVAEALLDAPLPPVYTEEYPADSARYARSLAPADPALRSWAALAPALAASRAYAAARPQDDIAAAHGSVAILWADIVRSLDRLAALLPRLDANPELLAANFTWLRLTQGADFSGYYEPVIKASPRPQGVYRTPLYRVPPDLHTLDLGRFAEPLIGQRLQYRVQQGEAVPYYSREDIDSKGALKNTHLELAYVADPVDAYFLHVQGSGRLVFPDGTERHILYAAKNGRPYTGIGRLLRDRGQLKSAVSMEAVRDWLAAHPADAQAVMNQNENYVFFRFADKGPIGGMGALLTPWVSLAVDRNLLPLGSLVAYTVDAPFPDGVTRPVHSLGLAQDTGGAVKGRRIDIYCGAGEAAAYTAGHLNTPGVAWLLLAKE